MRKITMLLVLLLCCLAGQAFAQDAENDVQAGFRLGKLYMSANMLASELEIIQILDESFQLEQITDENYDAGVITDDDITGAQMMLGYSLWRLQFMVLPVCEAGLDEDSFVEPSIAPFKDEVQVLLMELADDVYAFLEGSDFIALSEFVDVTLDADYTARLTDLATRAQATAGVEDDVPAGVEDETPAEAPAG